MDLSLKQEKIEKMAAEKFVNTEIVTMETTDNSILTRKIYQERELTEIRYSAS